MSESKTLILTDVPSGFLKRRIIRSHFSKYGTIVRSKLNESNNSCELTFESIQQAREAAAEGCVWKEIPLKIAFVPPTSFGLPEQDADLINEELNWYCPETGPIVKPYVLDRPPLKKISPEEEENKEVIKLRSNIKTELFSKKLAHDEEEGNRDIKAQEQDRQSLKLKRSKILDAKKLVPEDYRAAKSYAEHPFAKYEQERPSLKLKTHSKPTDASSRKVVRPDEEDEYFLVKAKGGTKQKGMEGSPKKVVRVEEEEEGRVTGKDGASLFKPCQSLNDRLAVLEERDRLLRMRLEKVIRLEKACLLKGICPDMCPEKERILRDARGILAPYEAAPSGSLDHGRAVKEYARSSADQEEPLPHELRPQPVLSMTMDYLLDQIIARIDTGEDNFANWYDFCWGRLRAIRKDIIQQQLCDLETVAIVEQCARFHIACYDRLWGMGQSQFDEKINTETLVNCLQSLSHMYQDLKKEGVSCPNQPEFTGYLVLVELNSGFLTAQYSRYSPSVQLSREVKEAVKIHLAYNNSMFSRYFRYTQQTSYLNACLMQRFFHHLRVRALDIVVKAHCVPNKVSNINVQFLVDSLKFDSFEDCITFCESCGLSLGKDNKHFKISRSDFNEPDNIYVTKNSSRLVTKKRLSIVQAVVGENSPLPVYIEHEVHSSFNKDGVLQQGALDASDQEEKMLRDVVERKLLLSRAKANRKSVSLSPTVLSEISPTKPETESPFTFSKVIESTTPEEPMDTESDFHRSTSSEDESYDEKSSEDEDGNVDIEEENIDIEDEFSGIEESSVSLPSIVVSSPTSEECDTSEHAPLISLPPEVVDTSIHLAPPKTIMEFPALTGVAVPPTPSSTFTFSFPASKSVSSTPNEQCEQPLPSSPKMLLPDDYISDKKQKIDKIRRDKDIYLSKLRKNLTENMKKISAKKYLKVWKDKIAKIKANRQLESLLERHLTIGDYLSVWGKGRRKENITMAHRLRNRKNNNLLVQILIHSDLIGKLDRSCKALGWRVTECLGLSAVRHAARWGNLAQPSPVFWKLVFALPAPLKNGTTFPLKLMQFLQHAFYQDKTAKIGDVQVRMSSNGVPIFTSVSVNEGETDQEKCKNLSALILITAHDWESPAQTQSRLKQILKLSKLPIPVFALTVGPNIERIARPADLAVSYFGQSSWSKSSTLISVASELASRTPLYNVKVKPFCTLIDTTAETFFDLLHQDRYINEGLDIVLSNPNNLVNFYNELIKNIEKEIIECHKLNYYGTACEFKNQLSHWQQYANLFPDNYFDSNFEKSFSLRSSKCKLHSIKWPFISTKDFYQFFVKYCDDAGCPNVVAKLMRFVNPPDDDDTEVDLLTHLNRINWLAAFEDIIKEILTSHFLTFKVAYRENEIFDILSSHWWLLSDPVIEKNKEILGCV